MLERGTKDRRRNKTKRIPARERSFEVLERRCLLAITAVWVGGSGDWFDSNNWDIGVVPNNRGGNEYDVVIDSQALDLVVTLDDPNVPVTIRSLRSSETLNVTGNELTVTREITNVGTLRIDDKSNDTRLLFEGSVINNDGQIEIESGFNSGLVISSDTLLDGTGNVEVDLRTTVGGSRTLTVGANQSISVGGTAEIEVDVINRGSILVGRSDSLLFSGSVINEPSGHIIADRGDITFFATPFGRIVETLRNHGTIEASNGTVDIHSYLFYPATGTVRATSLGSIVVRPIVSFNILANGIVGSSSWTGELVGGKWQADLKGVIRLLYNESNVHRVNITDLSADVELGSDGFLLGGSESCTCANFNALTNLDRITGSGRLALNKHNFTVGSSLEVFGDMHVGVGTTLNVPSGFYTQKANTLIVDGTLDVNSPVVIHPAGTLKGNGVVRGGLANTGIVAPGSSPGTLTIDGNFTQFSSGTLTTEIEGRGVGEYDQLVVTGSATLAGTARIELVDGFTPVVGDDFEILSSASVNGEFETHDFPQIDETLNNRFIPDYFPTGLTVDVNYVPLVEFDGIISADGANALMLPEHTAVDDSGNVFVTGFFQGTIDFDTQHVITGDTLTSSANGDGFIARYERTTSGLMLDWVNPIVNAHGFGVTLTQNVAYITGSFSGFASYGSSPSGAIAGTGNVSTFVLAIEHTGLLGSIRSISSTDSIIGRRIVFQDTNFFPYIAGEFSGSVTSGTTMTSAGSTDAFVMKVGTSVDYSVAFGGTGEDRATDIAIGTDGNLYVTGEQTFAGGFNGPHKDVFLRRLQPQSLAPMLLDETFYGGDGNDGGTSVDVDNDGNIIVGGYFEDSVDFDATALRSFRLHSGGRRDAFLLKLDYQSNPNSDTFHWARQFGGHRDDQVFDISIDSANNILSTGVFTDRVDFDPLNGSTILETETEFSQEAFVSQLNEDGEFDWAAQFAATSTGAFQLQSFGFNFLDTASTGRSLVVDSAGNVVTVGQFFESVEFDPTSGNAVESPVSQDGAGYVTSLRQTSPPVATIEGLPFSGSIGMSISQGTIIPLLASVTDSDSTQFEYDWSVWYAPIGFSPNELIATGNEQVMPLVLRSLGNYRVDLAVTDESGNRVRVSEGTIPLFNFTQESGLQPTSYSGVTQHLNPIPEVNARYGESLATDTVIRAGAPGTFGDLGAAEGFSTPGDVASGDLFGDSMAEFNNHLAVAAPGHDNAGTVFIRTPAGSIVEVAPASALVDRFGTSIAFSGGRLIVGSPGRTTPAGADDGWVYIYRLTDASNFDLERIIENPNPGAGDEFGFSVSAAGDERILVGTPGDDAAGLNAGAAYLFDLMTGELLAEFLNPTPDSTGDEFGATVASDGRIALVGAPSDDTAGTNAGGVYLFDVVEGSSTFGDHVSTLNNSNAGAGSFGSALTARAGRAMVGAETDSLSVANSGSAFLFNVDQQSVGFGNEIAVFKGSTSVFNPPQSGDRFGASVAFHDQEVVVGAPGRESPAGVQDIGAYFVFTPDEFAELSPNNLNEGESATLVASIYDPGVSDSHSVTTNWGDGTQLVELERGVRDFDMTHTYIDDSPGATSSITHNVSVSVVEENGSTSNTAAGDVTVNNVAPTVEVISVPSSTPGEFILRAVVADAGIADTFTYGWSGGLGATGPANQQEYRFTPAVVNATTITVLLVVNDDDGGSAVRRTRVVIASTAGGLLSVSNPPSGHTKLIVFGQDANDEIDASAVTKVPVEIVGGLGSDTITGGSQDDYLIGNSRGDYALSDPSTGDLSIDVLNGGAGNDTLDGGLGSDFLNGGTGNDTYIQVPGGADVLTETGPGIDTIDFQLSVEGVTFNLSQRNASQVVNPDAPLVDQNTVEIQGDFENVVGTGSVDVLTGNELANQINGLSDNDLIRGGDPLAGLADDGDDTLLGGFGDDTLEGGTGDDTIIGDDGVGAANLPDNDVIEGGLGNDTIHGGIGDDVIFGGDANDSESGSPFADDSIEGGLGNDSILGGSGNDIIFGGDQGEPDGPCSGGDTLQGGIGNDTLLGGSCNDVIFGGDPGDSEAGFPFNSDDSIRGGLGNDSLLGGSGNDVIFGGDESIDDDEFCTNDNDTLQGGLGNDSLLGGACNDVIFGGDPSDSELGFPFNSDTIRGGLGNDTLLGGSGNDVIFGGDFGGEIDFGNDSLIGGRGNDSLLGGSGNDVIFGGEITGNPPVDVEDAMPGDDTLHGGAGDDTLVGGPGIDELFGESGQDVLRGGSGLDILDGGVGFDVINELVDGIASFDTHPVSLLPEIIINGTKEILLAFEATALFGGPDDDQLNATNFNGAALIHGGDGNDTVTGSSFGDLLFGGPGNDLLVGGDGDDTLDGGYGDDTINGGLDNDTYVEVPGSTDVLQDPQGIDWLDFTPAEFGVDIDLSQAGTQTVDSQGNAIELIGTFENVRGSSFDDLLTGNAEINLLEGGGGRDLLNGLAGDDELQGGFPQLVYLDFDSHTSASEYDYSIIERNEIHDRLAVAFGWPFNVEFSQTAPSVGRFSTIAINAGDFAGSDIVIAGLANQLDWRNADSASFAVVNAHAILEKPDQDDDSTKFVNLTFTLIAHELGHLLGIRHTDSLGSAGRFSKGANPKLGAGVFSATDAVTPEKPQFWTDIHCSVHQLCGPSPTVNYLSPGYRSDSISLAGPILLDAVLQGDSLVEHQPARGSIFVAQTEIAEFNVEPNGNVTIKDLDLSDPLPIPTSGFLDAEFHVLSLTWPGAPPAQSYVSIAYDYDRFRPGYRGPEDATETPRHILASPASVGSTEDDALEVTILGERELVKLAFADVGGSEIEEELNEAATQPQGFASVAKELTLVPLAVPNMLLDPTLENAGKEFFVRSANVLGSIELVEGESQQDVFVIETTDDDQLLTLEVLSYSLRHRIANTIDSTLRVYDDNGLLLDYHGQPAFNDDALDNQDALLLDVLLPNPGPYYIEVGTAGGSDAGEYELFAYTFLADEKSRRLGGDGDVLIGAGGMDVAIASSGDDVIVGDFVEDSFVGLSQYDTVVGPNPPRVEQVYVGSRAWSDSFMDALGNDFGYRLSPVGIDSAIILPWSNLNTVSFQFSIDVMVDPSALIITGNDQNADYSIDLNLFSYDAANHVATWHLNQPFDTDVITLEIESTKIRNGITQEPLDGEVAANQKLPSGDGVADGTFTYLLHVLPGDLNRSGGVSVDDASPLRDLLGYRVGQTGYSILADTNGSGMIAVNDVGVVRTHLGVTLPGESQHVAAVPLESAQPEFGGLGADRREDGMGPWRREQEVDAVMDALADPIEGGDVLRPEFRLELVLIDDVVERRGKQQP